MPLFQVVFKTYAFTSVEVEAEDEADAFDKTEQAEMPTLCAQCSGWGRGNQPAVELSDVWETDNAYRIDDADPIG
jgi:hypothetical protein